MGTQSELTSSKEIIVYLSNQFPNCFTIEGEAKPLKIGIFQDIIERLANNEQFSKTKLRLALRLYTASWRYLYSIRDGEHRIDLDGNPTDIITSQQAAYAQMQLKESKEKIKTKRITENKDKRLRTNSSKLKHRQNTSKTAHTPKPLSDEIGNNPQKVDIGQLQIGNSVKVRLGSRPVSAIVSGIEKEHIKVKVPSGMELTVTIDHILI